MIVKIVHQPHAMRYDAYIYNDNYTQVATIDTDGQLRWEPYEQGTVPKVWMVFDEYVYQAFKRAMIGEAMDKDDALADTRNVRDRLLKMVETEWQSRQLEKQ